MDTKPIKCTICARTKSFKNIGDADIHANARHKNMYILCDTRNCKFPVIHKYAKTEHVCEVIGRAGAAGQAGAGAAGQAGAGAAGQAGGAVAGGAVAGGAAGVAGVAAVAVPEDGA